ncbi:MAG TPA: MFS transporter [Pseudonocardiaceae bacterium]|jgi:putative MFS transporter|nr:MFS transporter [Pseudonocardiaceae bacterium]
MDPTVDTTASAIAPNQLLGRLDRSAFTSQHLAIYLLLLAGHFLDGFVINVTGVVLPGVIKGFHLTSGQAGIFSSVLFGGMLVGAATAGVISDRLGRKYPLIVCLLVFSAFSLLAAFAWNYPALLAFRACQGIGLGAEIAIVLPYITEFVPSGKRAPMMTTATAAWLLGLPVAALVGAAIVPSLSWRSMFVVGAIPIVVALTMIWRLPESVRYLLRSGHNARAAVVVDALTGPATVLDPTAVPSVATAATPGSVRKLLSRDYLRYTLAIWLMELCAGAFLYGLATWLPSVLEKRGTSLLSSFAYTGIITAVGVVGSLLAGQLVNRTGRRWVLGGGFLLSGLFCLWWGAAGGTAGVLVLGSLATFFGSGLAGSTLYAYVGELYPTYNRATGLGWAAAWQKAGGLIIPTVIGFVLAAHASGYLFFVLFAVVSVIAGIAALAATFETKGKTVEQIAAEVTARGGSGVDTPIAAGLVPTTER